MSDFQNLDLRSPHSRRAGGGAMRGIVITLAVVVTIFVVLAALGAGTRGSETVTPAVQNELSAPAGDEAQPAPTDAAPVGE